MTADERKNRQILVISISTDGRSLYYYITTFSKCNLFLNFLEHYLKMLQFINILPPNRGYVRRAEARYRISFS